METQCKQILAYMLEHGSITSKEAFDELGCTRLSGRIFDLKQKGYIITKVRESSFNRFGKRVSYDRYSVNI